MCVPPVGAQDAAAPVAALLGGPARQLRRVALPEAHVRVPLAVRVRLELAQAPAPVLLAVGRQPKLPGAPPLLVCVFLYPSGRQDSCGVCMDRKEPYNMPDSLQPLMMHSSALT